MSLSRVAFAPEPRTLVDVFRETVDAHPHALALDNGVHTLTYHEFADAAENVALDLAAHGVTRGDRVGVRIASGTTDLYVAIMGVLLSGAAYVPVDADDPDERARTVFAEADVSAIIGNDLAITVRRRRGKLSSKLPQVTTDDDAWIIFTSGSTGKPKGVAVSHRSAAAFVDAEARLFCVDDELGPHDRVMAGLSVAFDASCEEMWLAWRHGACLVPAPRSLVKSGMDLGPWLVANAITVVSTVPTLVSLWPAEALKRVRLLILGGEACPPEIGTRFATADREVWNTYGPTEAAVVSCAARVYADQPVRIGLPLDGWDLAVVDAEGRPVPEGESGELIIGGVGLARYLDASKDAEKYAPMATLGWERAYRSGDLVVNDPEGLLFLGRADDQVKVGGRRIELGEIDAALMALPGVQGAAAAVRKTGGGSTIIVGYLATDDTFDQKRALATLRHDLPAALVPRLALVDDLPTRTSGKIDRAALPWPLPDALDDTTEATFTGTQAWVAHAWRDVLGSNVPDMDADFFDLGGTSLAVAHLVAKLRERYPEVGVNDVYDHPRLHQLASHLDEMDAPQSRRNAEVRPVPRKTQWGQLAAIIPLRTIGGLRWVTYLAAAANVAHLAGYSWLPTVSWWWILVGWVVLLSPPGRIVATVLGVKVILRGIEPGSYRRGGRVHLRLWLAERFAEEMGATNLASAVLMKWYARLLGAYVGREVDLHSVPPVTGFLALGDGCSIELEVDLSGYWIDGDTVTIGQVFVGPDARVGARSTLAPGSNVKRGAEVAPGSVVLGVVPRGEYWAGSPAQPTGHPARGPWEPEKPPRRPWWTVGYAITSTLIALLPLSGVAAGVACAFWLAGPAETWGVLVARLLPWLPLATLAGFAVLALEVLVLVRLLGLFIEPGHHPVQSARGWAPWATMRILDEARTWLYPLYAGWFTTWWLRLLGAHIGRDAEASTVVLLPKLASVGQGSFLADDTMLAGYELGGGWLRVERAKLGKHAFLGNSGMIAPGRKVPKGGLVAVLSAAPRRTQAKKETSWVGSPPAKLRRTTQVVDQSLTYHPTPRLRVLRAVVELFRIVAVMLSKVLGLGVVAVLGLVAIDYGWWAAALASGVVLVLAGTLGAWLTAAIKWLVIGRVAPGEHPLWSSFVWRNELADTFIECVAAAWFVRWTIGTSLLNAWFRAMGAQVGRGVWCETYWLPEPDLIELQDGVTINRGCVVQTHLFHDRVLSLDKVTLRRGATLGPNSVILPASTIGRYATIGPASLVMRGESVPSSTRWLGNPIGPEHRVTP